MRDIRIPLARYAELTADLDRIEGIIVYTAFAERDKIRQAIEDGLELTEHQAAILAVADDTLAAAATRICRLIEMSGWLGVDPPNTYLLQFYATHSGRSEE